MYSNARIILALVAAVGLNTTIVSTSAAEINWQLFASSQGARLNASQTTANGERGTQVMGAICSPQDPRPYIAAVVRIPSGIQKMPTAQLAINLGNGGTEQISASTDPIATVNAGDDLVRYGMSLDIGHPFFQALLSPHYSPSISLSGYSNGIELQVPDIQKIGDVDQHALIRNFLNTCESFGGNTTTANAPQEQPSVCRDYLNSPNDFATSATREYSKELSDTVCAANHRDPRAAVCMHYVMAGQLPLNIEGDRTWDPADAARFCVGNTNLPSRVSCFDAVIRENNSSNAGIQRCKDIN